MQITPMCRALALHEIFENRGVGAGGRMMLSVLEQAWTTSGLRQCDLAECLADARVTGEFSVYKTPDGCEVTLTERGHEHAQRDLSNLRDIDELIRAYATLSLARRRPAAGVAFGRRRADQLNS